MRSSSERWKDYLRHNRSGSGPLERKKSNSHNTDLPAPSPRQGQTRKMHIICGFLRFAIIPNTHSYPLSLRPILHFSCKIDELYHETELAPSLNYFTVAKNKYHITSSLVHVLLPWSNTSALLTGLSISVKSIKQCSVRVFRWFAKGSRFVPPIISDLLKQTSHYMIHVPFWQSWFQTAIWDHFISSKRALKLWYT